MSVGARRGGRGRTGGGRSGFIAVALVLLLGAVSLMTLGALEATGEDADLSALRVETCRAFYAAESGAIVLMTEMSAGRDPPELGVEVSLDGDQHFVVVDEPLDGMSGEIVLEGVSGFATRRLTLYVE